MYGVGELCIPQVESAVAPPAAAMRRQATPQKSGVSHPAAMALIAPAAIAKKSESSMTMGELLQQPLAPQDVAMSDTPVPSTTAAPALPPSSDNGMTMAEPVPPFPNQQPTPSQDADMNAVEDKLIEWFMKRDGAELAKHVQEAKQHPKFDAYMDDMRLDGMGCGNSGFPEELRFGEDSDTMAEELAPFHRWLEEQGNNQTNHANPTLPMPPPQPKQPSPPPVPKAAASKAPAAEEERALKAIEFQPVTAEGIRAFWSVMRRKSTDDMSMCSTPAKDTVLPPVPIPQILPSEITAAVGSNELPAPAHMQPLPQPPTGTAAPTDLASNASTLQDPAQTAQDPAKTAERTHTPDAYMAPPSLPSPVPATPSETSAPTTQQAQPAPPSLPSPVPATPSETSAPTTQQAQPAPPSLPSPVPATPSETGALPQTPSNTGQSEAGSDRAGYMRFYRSVRSAKAPEAVTKTLGGTSVFLHTTNHKSLFYVQCILQTLL